MIHMIYYPHLLGLLHQKSGTCMITAPIAITLKVGDKPCANFLGYTVIERYADSEWAWVLSALLLFLLSLSQSSSSSSSSSFSSSSSSSSSSSTTTTTTTTNNYHHFILQKCPTMNSYYLYFRYVCCCWVSDATGAFIGCFQYHGIGRAGKLGRIQ